MGPLNRMTGFVRAGESGLQEKHHNDQRADEQEGQDDFK
ncbi:hypothetical protein Dd1591_1787 [Dickeya chrysanthemi Ech1591]|uniref:Uncharacterized protein n=1 Tax=Dickeya chrysanthemi (strain Ech1591) TaxID=561229 RepID=C6CG68_DICC1|nr:hypothetical protein Dd1591_1787 [Dickeya chrysanthemi Ech1591]